MTEHSLWRFSRALHRAINERQPQDLEALLDEDVDWAIYGPIDMFPFFGSRRGKAAVKLTDVPGAFGGDGGRFDPETELPKRFRGLEDDLIPSLPALLEREVEVALCDLQSEYVGLEQAQRLAEQLLPGLVAVKHGDGGRGHRSNHMARSELDRAWQI